MLLALAAHPAHASDDTVLRPAWLVGTWEAKGPDGRTLFVLGPEGGIEFRAEAGDGSIGSVTGTWREQGGRLHVTAADGSTDSYAIERVASADGAERVRFLPRGEPGSGSAISKVADATPGRPEFAIGTWVVRTPNGPMRVVLFANGTGRRVTHAGVWTTETIDAWRFDRGALVVGKERIDWTFLPPDGERLRTRWTSASGAEAIDFVRESWPRALSPTDDLVTGRWRRRDGVVPVVWTFRPDGTADLRRRVTDGTTRERATYSLVRGARGPEVSVATEAGRRIRRLVRVEGESMTLRDEESGRVESFERVPGSPSAVRREAIDEATERADVIFTREAFFGARTRVPSRPSDADPASRPERKPRAPVPIVGPDASDSVPDPDPDDVIPGAEVLLSTTIYVGESEAVGVRLVSGNVSADAEDSATEGRATPKSARPREAERYELLATGRAVLVRTLFGADGTASEVSTVRFGRYQLNGSRVTIDVAGERPIEGNLAEGGAELHVGVRVFTEVDTWTDTPVDPTAR